MASEVVACYNQTCPRRERCHRYTLLPVDGQRFRRFEIHPNGGCDNYLEPTDVLQKTESHHEV